MDRDRKTVIKLIEMRCKLISFSWKETSLHVRELRKLTKELLKDGKQERMSNG